MTRDLTNPNRIAVEWVTPVREDSAAPPVFLLPGNLDEGNGFRRLADQLGPAYPLAIVRPLSKTWFTASPYMMEDIIAIVANLVRDASSDCPFIIGGFCLGGVIAWEAARQLEPERMCRGVIMFDSAMPGYPNPLSLRQWRTVPALLSRYSKADAKALRFLVQRLIWKPAWQAVLHLRKPMQRWWHTRALRSLHVRAKHHDQSYVWPRPISVPVLHVITADKDDILFDLAMTPWELLARGPFQLEVVHFGHRQMFTRDALPKLAAVVGMWLT